MLNVIYSNQTEALLDALAQRIQTHWQAPDGNGIWDPVRLVVPNPFLKEHIRIGLAKRLGIAANLRFSYLDGLWREILKDDAPRVLGSDLMRAGLMKVLQSPEELEGSVFDPVRAYLQDDPQGLKVVQFATEMARLFEEYHYSRPEWVQAWREDRPLPIRLEGGMAQSMEAWQRALWRSAVKALDEARNSTVDVQSHPDSQRYQTLGEAIQGISRSTEAGRPAAIHVFGMSHVASVYHRVYAELADLGSTDLHVYALNPCAEFWEDLATDRERARLRPTRAQSKNAKERVQPCDLIEEEEEEEEEEGATTETAEGVDEDIYGLVQEGPEALRLWGRPGRENIRLLNEVSHCDFHAEFRLPETDTLLANIQRDILLFQDPEVESKAAPDPSVRLLAAPSPRREAEIVATEIWRLMELHAQEDRPLSFSEIAVVVPPAEQEAYLAHLQTAFQEVHRIPWIHSTGALPVMRQTLEAVERLLDLPGSGNTRAALLAVLGHPAIQKRFAGLDAAAELNTEAWPRWCESLGIVRGADREAWTDTYVQADVLNWDQGLKRLALGAFMAEGSVPDGQEATFRVPGMADAEGSAAFLSLSRRLLADSRRLEQARLDVPGWIAQLEPFLETWLEADAGIAAGAPSRANVRADDEPTIKALDRIRTFLNRLKDSFPPELRMAPLGFKAMRYLVLEALRRLRDEQPASLAKGVVVSSYAPMRAIPFRATFLMGLGEGVFPTRDRRSALDLRAKGRQAGDVSQTEKEKYLFLEMLLSTREHLILSHVAMDELSGEAQEPSGLWKEFRALLGRYLDPRWKPKGRDPLLESHPLRRFDEAYFPQWFPAGDRDPRLKSYSPEALGEARALWLRRDLAAHGPLELPTTLADLPLNATQQDMLQTHLSFQAPVGQTPSNSRSAPTSKTLHEGPLRLTLGDLRKWLECPLTGAAAVRLGLRSEDLEDRSAVTDEMFELDPLEIWNLRQTITLQTLRQGLNGQTWNLDSEAIFDQVLTELQAQARAPFGLFAKLERPKILGPVQAWVAYLQTPERNSGSIQTWRLGPSRSYSMQVDHAMPALELDVELFGKMRRVSISGDLRPQRGGSLFLETGKPPSPGHMDSLRKKALAAYLDHLVLSLIEEGKRPGETGHGSHRARFIFEEAKTDGCQEVPFTFPALKPAEAQRMLEDWIRDLVEENQDMLMPIESVLDGWGDGHLTPESIRTFVDQESEKEFSSLTTLKSPVPQPTRALPPPDPMRLVRRRLGPFLECVFPSNATMGEVQ